MTSNQINAALAREEKRHNIVVEQQNAAALEETRKQNKRANLLKAADNINTAAANISHSIGQSYSNAINAANQAAQQYGIQKEAQYKSTMSDISTRQQQEQERYNKRQNELTLRNIQHLEYQDQLTALRDEWQRNVDIHQATRDNAEITVKTAANSINAYLAEIQRANLNVDQYRAYVSAMQAEYEMALAEAKTDEARSRIVTNYINATTNVLNSIMGATARLSGMTLGL